MNQQDFKKLLDEALGPIKQQQESQSSALSSIKARQESQSSALSSIKQKQESHSSALSIIKDKQESHSAALVSIESKLDAYGDMYKINSSNAKKLEKRVETLEENAGITPPPEFTLAEIQ